MKKRGTQSNYKLKWPCMEPLGYPNPTSYYLLGAELIVGVKPTREYILKLAMLQPHNQKFDLWRLLLLDEVSDWRNKEKKAKRERERERERMKTSYFKFRIFRALMVISR
ncbi:hypothetical protein PVK06_028310 [Gossypium arboreum]|uniref:Uncharacterized protein n=1 Tax=Gossypium arboreum TaxID=29729 RepID=A0ABR0P2N9_GOSAR|nr:hypothetical protein PVK06_028310 [Gossypium arboreum]